LAEVFFPPEGILITAQGWPSSAYPGRTEGDTIIFFLPCKGKERKKKIKKKRRGALTITQGRPKTANPGLS